MRLFSKIWGLLPLVMLAACSGGADSASTTGSGVAELKNGKLSLTIPAKVAALASFAPPLKVDLLDPSNTPLSFGNHAVTISLVVLDGAIQQKLEGPSTLTVSGSSATFEGLSLTLPGGPYKLHASIEGTEIEGDSPEFQVTSGSPFPNDAAISAEFKDEDFEPGKIAGTLIITRAAREESLVRYAVYWSDAKNQKLGADPIVVLSKTLENLSYVFAKGTKVPAGATGFSIRSQNDAGEMDTGFSLPLVDLGVPVHAAVSAKFVDEDPDGEEVQGRLTIARAEDESDLTAYTVSWSDDAYVVVGSSPVGDVVKNGMNLYADLPKDTKVPAGATHLLVRTRNADGLMLSGVTTAIDDLGVPRNAAVSVGFADEDSAGGGLAGPISIGPALSQDDISSYAIYWANDAEAKVGSNPLAVLPKSTGALQYDLPLGTSPPAGATRFLILTRNEDGEMRTGRSAAIDDVGIPVHPAASVSFSDEDYQLGHVSGTIAVARAADESDVTRYRIYWGQNSTTRLSSTPLAQLSATGSDQTQALPTGTSVPATATHILVFSVNDDGEMPTGVACAIIDLGTPTAAPVSLSLVDGDITGGELAGIVTIGAAVDESLVTHYSLYWGSDSSTKSSATPIAIVAKSGTDVSYAFPANTPIPATARYLLAYARRFDFDGANAVSWPILDQGAPLHAAASLNFFDADGVEGRIGGDLQITKAADESDVDSYVIYWGIDATTRLSETPIATLAKTGGNLVATLAMNTVIPNQATHFLVFTKHDFAEMLSPTAHAFHDRKVPTASPSSVAAEDANLVGAKFEGDVTITPPADDSTVDGYALYWGSDATTKVSDTPIGNVDKVAATPVTITVPANTSIPPTATTLLAFSRNGDGERSIPTALTFHDKAIPVHKAQAVSFVDTAPGVRIFGGTLTISKAADESDVTSYEVYFGFGELPVNSAIGSLAKTGADLTWNMAPIDSYGASDILIVTKNDDGLMATGIHVALNDFRYPVAGPSALTVVDSDPDDAEIGGTITIGKAASEADVDSYQLYWGTDYQTRLSNTPFATVNKTGSDAIYTVPANTPIPAGATVVFVHAKNAAGENPYAKIALVYNCVNGTELAGGCWYASDYGESCDAACSTHGGYMILTNTYAGRGGDQGKCVNVAQVLGVATGGVDVTSAGTGKGCAWVDISGDSILTWETSAATTSSASTANYRRACACKH